MWHYVYIVLHHDVPALLSVNNMSAINHAPLAARVIIK